VSLAIVKFSRQDTGEPAAYVGVFTGSTPAELTAAIDKFTPTLGPVEICPGNNGSILPNISINWTVGGTVGGTVGDEFIVKNNDILTPSAVYTQAIPNFNLPALSSCSTSQFSSPLAVSPETRSLSYGVNWLNFLILILIIIILLLIIYYFFFKKPVACVPV